jgi:hypothetical protein
MPDDDIAVVELLYEAFAVRDLHVLERLSSEAMVERDGDSAELPAAWSWKLVAGKVTYVRVLPHR